MPSQRPLLSRRPGMVDVLTCWSLCCLAGTAWLLLRYGRQWERTG